MSNYIQEYHDEIKAGRIRVGKWIRLLYDYIEKGLDEGAFFYSQKKADAVIVFIENFCHHHEGELAPGLIKLELWQKAALSAMFAIVDKNGNRQFREVFWVMGRKNGKTLLGAAIAEYMAFLDGEYGGRIYFAAPKLEQANLCFEAFHQMILQEPELDRMAQKRRTDIYIQANNTTAKPLAFNAKKSDGLNISFCVADECASWAGDAGLKYYEVIKSSVGARKQPMILGITTSGYENEGIYDELMKRSSRFLLGDSKETRLLPLIYMVDDPERWKDLDELRKSMPNMGVSVTEDYILEEMAIAEGSPSKLAEFMTKYCCIKQNSSLAWLDAQTVERCCGTTLSIESFRSSYAVAGIDLSQTTDLTAAVVVVEKDGELYVFAKFWLPAEKIDEATQRDGLPYQAYINRGILEISGQNYIDYHDCFNWLTELVEQYEILPLMTGYDRYSAQYLIQDMNQYGFRTDDVYQGTNLWGVLQEMEGLFKDGKVHIGDNDLMKVHMLNAAIKMDTVRARGKLVKIEPMAHIDGLAAMADAFCVRQKWYDQIGEQLRNQ